MNYRVLVFDADGLTGWNLSGVYAGETDARVCCNRAKRECRVAAVVLVRGCDRRAGESRLEVIDANVPRPERLLDSVEFRNVATAL